MSSTIEWTDETWNPVVGCSVASPGCDNCYAAGVASRQMQPAHKGLTVGRQWNGTVRLLPERLVEPLKWRAPRRVFVNSMSDLFHPDVPDQFIAETFAVMAVGHRHTFQVLTKRPQRMAQVLAAGYRQRQIKGYHDHVVGPTGRPGYAMPADYSTWRETMASLAHRWAIDRTTAGVLSDSLMRGAPVPNVWLGTSIENDSYTFRANHLRATPAAVRFVSLEPLIGPMPSMNFDGIDWVIVGGESGPGCRPIDLNWVRDLRDRTLEAGAAFFFKQWGGRTAKANGRELDGRTWDEYPAQ